MTYPKLDTDSPVDTEVPGEGVHPAPPNAPPNQPNIIKLDIDGFKKRFKQVYPQDDKGHYETYLNPVLEAIRSQDVSQPTQSAIVIQSIKKQRQVLKNYQDINATLKKVLIKTLDSIKDKLENVSLHDIDRSRYPRLAANAEVKDDNSEGAVYPVKLFYPLELLPLELAFEKDFQERYQFKDVEKLNKFKQNYLYPMLKTLAKLEETENGSYAKPRESFFGYMKEFNANREKLRNDNRYSENAKAVKAFDECLHRLKKNIRAEIKASRPELYRLIAGGLEEERHKQIRFDNLVTQFSRCMYFLSTPLSCALSAVLFIFKYCGWEYVDKKRTVDMGGSCDTCPDAGDCLVDVVQIKEDWSVQGTGCCVVDSRYHLLAPKQSARHLGEDLVKLNEQDDRDNTPTLQVMA